jgi:hypothetical protein
VLDEVRSAQRAALRPLPDAKAQRWVAARCKFSAARIPQLLCEGRAVEERGAGRAAACGATVRARTRPVHDARTARERGFTSKPRKVAASAKATKSAATVMEKRVIPNSGMPHGAQSAPLPAPAVPSQDGGGNFFWLKNASMMRRK